MRSSIWLCMALGLGCGGKIVETTPIPEEKPLVPEAPKTAPTTVTALDACEVLCERDARCDTTLPALPARDGESGDCKTRCNERLAGKCGVDDWLLCYASKIERGTCTPLPDVCRAAFCAWATCARQPVSNCE